MHDPQEGCTTTSPFSRFSTSPSPPRKATHRAWKLYRMKASYMSRAVAMYTVFPLKASDRNEQMAYTGTMKMSRRMYRWNWGLV